MKRVDLALRVVELRKELKNNITEDKRGNIEEQINKIISYLEDTEYKYDIEDLHRGLLHENDKMLRWEAVYTADYQYNGEIDLNWD